MPPSVTYLSLRASLILFNKKGLVKTRPFSSSNELKLELNVYARE
jgi:hypothetical protein